MRAVVLGTRFTQTVTLIAATSQRLGPVEGARTLRGTPGAIKPFAPAPPAASGSARHRLHGVADRLARVPRRVRQHLDERLDQRLREGAPALLQQRVAR